MIITGFFRKALSVAVSLIVELTGMNLQGLKPEKQIIDVKDLKVSEISVSCLKVSWKGKKNRDYTVKCTSPGNSYKYTDNMYFVFKKSGLCYITGLRENTPYKVTVKPLLKKEEKKDKEKFSVKSSSFKCRTEKVKAIQTYPKEEGWTNCFAGESAYGLTALPSSGAIAGSVTDCVTGTGIRRDEYGDYCCAMGLFYGKVGDRMLIELENGTQFTVKICDSKGLADDGKGKYHRFGNDGKCIVEFIFEDSCLPENVAFSGTWGKYSWNGLDLTSNIKSIKKIEFGKKIQY